MQAQLPIWMDVQGFTYLCVVPRRDSVVGRGTLINSKWDLKSCGAVGLLAYFLHVKDVHRSSSGVSAAVMEHCDDCVLVCGPVSTSDFLLA